MRVVPYDGNICYTKAATLANCRLSLNTGWFVVHRDIANGSRYASAMKQNLCLLHSACLYTIVSPCIRTVGIHAPAAYSDVAVNATAIPCTIGGYTPAIVPSCLS